MVDVVHVCPWFRPHVGGVESHVEAVARELARRGREVAVLTTRLPGTPDRERHDGYDIVRVEASATLFATPIAPALAPAIARLAPKVVHTHSPPPLTSWTAAREAARLGIPLVHTHHCDLELPLPGGRLAVEAYRRSFGRATMRRAAVVVATTQSYARTSRDLWKSPVEVVPNPVDETRFHPGVGGARVRRRFGLDGRIVAMYVGRLTHHKGVEQFVRSAEHSPEAVTHLVVGDGPRRRALEAIARDLPGARKVVFAGAVGHDELPEFYGASDMCVLPSTSRLEAFGIAALEAMASARPVVVSDIPGVTEVVEEGVSGLLVEPFSAEDLGRKLARLAEDPKLREGLGLAGRARVLDRFTVSKVVDRLETIYARLKA